MAKAREIAGLAADTRYGDAAARVVETRARELADLSVDVLDTEDIERLHDMRVATRRLRAALEFFRPCFPKSHFKRVLREVKDLADALGERRDRDVAIAALSKLGPRFSQADRAGVESLIVRMQREQADANEALEPLVAPGRLAALTEQLEMLALEASGGSPAEARG